MSRGCVDIVCILDYITLKKFISIPNINIFEWSVHKLYAHSYLETLVDHFYGILFLHLNTKCRYRLLIMKLTPSNFKQIILIKFTITVSSIQVFGFSLFFKWLANDGCINLQLKIVDNILLISDIVLTEIDLIFIGIHAKRWLQPKLLEFLSQQCYNSCQRLQITAILWI